MFSTARWRHISLTHWNDVRCTFLVNGTSGSVSLKASEIFVKIEENFRIISEIWKKNLAFFNTNLVNTFKNGMHFDTFWIILYKILEKRFSDKIWETSQKFKRNLEDTYKYWSSVQRSWRNFVSKNFKIILEKCNNKHSKKNWKTEEQF